MSNRTKSGYSSFTYLQRMLAQGWRVEPPVYVRPYRQPRSHPANTYHFILWNGNKVNLVSVHDSPEIQAFLEESKLVLDHL